MGDELVTLAHALAILVYQNIVLNMYDNSR